LHVDEIRAFTDVFLPGRITVSDLVESSGVHRAHW
jgi:hypothetical protein